MEWVVGFFLLWIVWGLISNISGRGKKEVIYTQFSGEMTVKQLKQRRRPRSILEIEKPDIEITEEVSEILDILENSNQNVFLTGKAGTGKSTLLKYFRATTRKQHALVAPTGVAAVNVQGQTIHSFFKFRPGITPDRVRSAGYERSKLYRNLEVLIIDEISMVRADLFDCIDRSLRLNKGRLQEPFGGVQVVMVGDLFQLAPVLPDDERIHFSALYKNPYFFGSNAYPQGKFIVKELSKIYRQSDESFIEILNAIRGGELKDDHLILLNQRVITDELHDEPELIHLVTTNRMAEEINRSKLSSLPGKEKVYTGQLVGDFGERNLPTEEHLALKPGARVMLLNNDKYKRWINGDIVTILSLLSNNIRVEFDDGSFDDVTPYIWENVRFVFDEQEKKIVPEITGSFTQLPVKLAWALTIHKAQGKTFNNIFVDLGAGAFAPGQVYVALSRCTTREGLKLAAPIMIEDIQIDPVVREFIQTLIK